MPIGVDARLPLNVNCSDLERSLGFYRDLLGLTQRARTPSPPSRTAPRSGSTQAQWDAWIMLDERGYDGVVVDLLEWQMPRPDGRADAGAATTSASAASASRRPTSTRVRAARRGGRRCFGAPHDVEHRRHRRRSAPLVCADPDGTLVELVSGPTPQRFSFLAVNCPTSTGRSSSTVACSGSRSRAPVPPGPQDGAALGLGPDGRVGDGVPRRPATAPARSRSISSVEDARRPTGRRHESANRLGPFRLALFTDDIDRDHDALVAATASSCWRPPADLEMGPGIPPLRALLFPDPDGTMLELIEPPTLTPGSRGYRSRPLAASPARGTACRRPSTKSPSDAPKAANIVAAHVRVERGLVSRRPR